MAAHTTAGSVLFRAESTSEGGGRTVGEVGSELAGRPSTEMKTRWPEEKRMTDEELKRKRPAILS